jgi:hypothetical protein
LEEFYKLSPFSVLVGFSGSSTGNNGAGDPATISFDVTAVFGDNSVQIPTTADLDVLIETALQPPAVNALLDQLAALGAGNPFAGTVNAVYSPPTTRHSITSPSSFNAEREPTEKAHVTAQVAGSLAAVAAVLVSLAALVAVRRRRKEGACGEQAAKADVAIDEEDNCSVGTDAAVSDVDTASLFDEATQDLD